MPKSSGNLPTGRGRRRNFTRSGLQSLSQHGSRQHLHGQCCSAWPPPCSWDCGGAGSLATLVETSGCSELVPSLLLRKLRSRNTRKATQVSCFVRTTWKKSSGCAEGADSCLEVGQEHGLQLSFTILRYAQRETKYNVCVPFAVTGRQVLEEATTRLCTVIYRTLWGMAEPVYI